MSIEHIQGDLLDFPAGINVVAHCSNCFNTMGAGIAKSIKERYPAAFEADKEAYLKHDAYVGGFSYADVGNGKKIINIYGQYRYSGNDKRHLDYDGFFVAMEKVKELLEIAYHEGRHYVLGVPHKIGCARAGGDWNIVYSMLETLFKNSPVKLVIVELPKKEGAAVAEAYKTKSDTSTFKAAA